MTIIRAFRSRFGDADFLIAQGQSSRGDQREGSASATGSRGVTGVQPNGIGRGVGFLETRIVR